MKTSTTHFCLAIITCFFLTAGCSHTHRFNPRPEIGAVNGSPVTGKRLALDWSRTPRTFDGKANGHRFHLTGIRDHAQHMAHSIFINEKIVDAPQHADIILALALQLELSAGFLGAECATTATWDIKSPTGQLLATGQARDDASNPLIAVTGVNCEMTALRSIAAALDNAFAKLTAMPAAPVSTAQMTAAPIQPQGHCTMDVDCPAELICVNNTCGESAPTPIREPPATGQCTKDVDCPGDQICTNNSCTTPNPAQTTCTKDTDCPGNLVCNNALCTVPN